MRKLLYLLRKYAQTIFRVLMFIISAAILLIVYPREGTFPYEFQKGKAWLHEDYLAPFDFPVRKSEVEINIEKDSILKEFKPYFNYLPEVAVQQLKKLSKDFDVQWANFANGKTLQSMSNEKVQFFKSADSATVNRYKNYLIELMSYVYQRGIIQLSEPLESYVNRNFSLVVIRDKEAEEGEFYDLFTQKSAYEYIVTRINSNDNTNSPGTILVESGFYKELDINNYLLPNLNINEEASKNVKNELIGQISYTKGMFLADHKIISNGEIVNEEKFQVLNSLKFEYENRLGHSGNYITVLIGHGLVITILLLLLMFFLVHFRRDFYHNNLKYSFILIMIVMVVGVTSVITKNDMVNIYAIPFALLPIVLKTFYDARLALYIHTICILMVGFMAPNAFEFTFLNFVAGAVSIISLKSLYRRGKLFNTSLFVFVAYSLIYFSLFLLQGNPLKMLSLHNFVYFAISASLLLMAYPLIFVFERLFGFLSDITLMELSDTNQPLLRKLNEKAPGTFQHSLQVANLAEEAAYKIGANPLMVRTGALYHDIGKMHNPMYFIENLSSGKNPHDDISYEASAQVIIDHVTRGVEIARKNRLPEQIIDFIRTHHGTTTVHFFYRSFKRDNPGSQVDKSIFTYPGPQPFSKETALVMMADSVEAASRSIKEYTKEAIDDLVDQIIYYQMTHDQYNNTSITYKDIITIKNIFKRKLMSIYHVRVEYPDMV
jgi:cyclic-di-AMP phosphodiesterase PgpH